jgi:hypothetical protein
MNVSYKMVELEDDGSRTPLTDIRTITQILDAAFQYTGFDIILDKLESKKFCSCCGLSTARILEKLNGMPWQDTQGGTGIKIRSDALHVQYSSNLDPEKFQSVRSLVSCCEHCGVMLQETDIRGRWEILGVAGKRPQREYIVTGYVCHYCGVEEIDNVVARAYDITATAITKEMKTEETEKEE